MIVEGCWLFGIAFVGSVFWFVSTEGFSVYYGFKLGWDPVSVGLIAGVGTGCSYFVLYFIGDWLMDRWRWLGKKVEHARARWGSHLESYYLVLAAVAGVFGIPPALAMALLASGFGVRLAFLLPILVTTRALRYGLLASFGDRLQVWFPGI